MPDILLPALMNEGDIIGTRHKLSPFWVTNIVYKLKGDIFFTALKEEYVKNSIMPGDPFCCKFGRDYLEYVIEGTVESIFPQKGGYVQIRATKYDEVVSARQHQRYDLNLCANVLSAVDNVPHFSIIRNISKGGAAFISNYYFDYDEEVTLNVFFNNSSMLGPTGRIIRRISRDNNSEYSISFTRISDTDLEALDAFIRVKAIEEEKMIRFFEESIRGYV